MPTEVHNLMHREWKVSKREAQMGSWICRIEFVKWDFIRY